MRVLFCLPFVRQTKLPSIENLKFVTYDDNSFNGTNSSNKLFDKLTNNVNKLFHTIKFSSTKSLNKQTSSKNFLNAKIEYSINNNTINPDTSNNNTTNSDIINNNDNDNTTNNNTTNSDTTNNNTTNPDTSNNNNTTNNNTTNLDTINDIINQDTINNAIIDAINNFCYNSKYDVVSMYGTVTLISLMITNISQIFGLKYTIRLCLCVYNVQITLSEILSFDKDNPDTNFVHIYAKVSCNVQFCIY